MSKYPIGAQRVVAVYDATHEGNPFLAALPGMMPQEDFMHSIRSLPPLPSGLRGMAAEERRQHLPMLSSLFVPMHYMYAIYDQLFRALTSTYTTRTMIEEVRHINALFQGSSTPFATQPDTGSILGVPGVGKTSTIRRALSLLPQVIEHTEYNATPFFCKQVLYLNVECPSDCSVKALALNIVAALDKAIDSNYLRQFSSLRSVAASALTTKIKILCLTHHIGLLLIDEVQNLVTTAQKSNQIKPLIKFLVELTNDTCTSVYFVGTPAAEELFTSQEHLKRRTRGMRLLPLKPDGSYRAFLKALWPYQLTPHTAPLTEPLANKLFDASGGIPAYIVKIFQESQAQALLHGESCISSKIMQRAISLLSIKPPRTYAAGTYISDFHTPSTEEEAPLFPDTAEPPAVVKRLYANPRGRKAAHRDGLDLVAAYESGRLDECLHANKLLQPWSQINKS